ncbi:MAG: membrane protease YdiL (CAAX protease family) [Rhodothermales bacterium]|jgi:membrane protease YdiL (CAAX protease family)
MLLTWTHASFFEELLFRAFVITKGSSFLGGGMRADLAAALFSAVFFGYSHYYYQGMHGALTTGAAGLAFAMLYLWFGRKNILPLVLAHGVVNSIGMTLPFRGIGD